MSTNLPIPYATYTYASELYANSFVGETFVATLSDSITGTEADVIQAIKALAESLALSDSDIKKITKVLSDSTTITDAISKLPRKSFSDALVTADSTVTISTIKSLLDFLVIKEWIAIDLEKNITWVQPGGNENIFDTLYGKYLYGRNSGITLYGGARPTANWGLGQKRSEEWTNVNGHKYNI